MTRESEIWGLEAQARAAQCEELLIDTQKERDGLRQQNKRLVEALNAVLVFAQHSDLDAFSNDMFNRVPLTKADAINNARAALASVEGKS